jgi:hypothetical protein
MDVSRRKKLARAKAKTAEGRLYGWWLSKYAQQSPLVPFEERTFGGLIQELYNDAAQEIERLRGKLKTDGYHPDTEAKIADLEALFSETTTHLQDLTPEESLDAWLTARTTGDPVVDAWEAAIARGETPDLDDDDHGNRSQTQSKS